MLISGENGGSGNGILGVMNAEGNGTPQIFTPQPEISMDQNTSEAAGGSSRIAPRDIEPVTPTDDITSTDRAKPEGRFTRLKRMFHRTGRGGLRGQATYNAGPAEVTVNPSAEVSASTSAAESTVSQTVPLLSEPPDSSDVSISTEPVSVSEAPLSTVTEPEQLPPTPPTVDDSASGEIVIGATLGSTEARAREAGGFGASAKRAYENAQFAAQRKDRRDARTRRHDIADDASWVKRKAKIAVGSVTKIPQAHRERAEAKATGAEVE